MNDYPYHLDGPVFPQHQCSECKHKFFRDELESHPFSNGEFCEDCRYKFDQWIAEAAKEEAEELNSKQE